MHSYFSALQLTCLIIGLTCLLISALLHIQKKYQFSLILLILSALGIFSFAALLDPFLNLWDERFHALVAKNLMNHPFKPTLYDWPIVNMAYNERWDRYHIWLHKQPLFLWQMTLSFKLFGISEFALRLPSVILGSVFVGITYRSAALLTNRNVAFFSACLIITSINFIELVAGRQLIDHNDVSFAAYVSLSIWALIEYHFTGKRYWILLIGLFSGFAILCKWLVGLLVYLGWGLLKLQKRDLRLLQQKDIASSLLITLCSALPWQIYTFIKYPEMAAKEMAYNAKHFGDVIEGHSGNWQYHFTMIDSLYGTFASFLIIPGFIFMYRAMQNKALFISMVSMVSAVYLFFTIAATKMPLFTFAVSMTIFIALGSFFAEFYSASASKISRSFLKKGLFPIFFAGLVVFRMDLEYLQATHTLWKDHNQYSRQLIHNKEVFQSLTLPENTVLFNVKGRHYVEAMFYSDYGAYNFIPSQEQAEDLRQKNLKIAIFQSEGLELPEYLKNDKQVIVIDKELQGFN